MEVEAKAAKAKEAKEAKGVKAKEAKEAKEKAKEKEKARHFLNECRTCSSTRGHLLYPSTIVQKRRKVQRKGQALRPVLSGLPELCEQLECTLENLAALCWQGSKGLRFLTGMCLRIVFGAMSVKSAVCRSSLGFANRHSPVPTQDK